LLIDDVKSLRGSDADIEIIDSIDLFKRGSLGFSEIDGRQLAFIVEHSKDELISLDDEIGKG
jgi:hypothetical protein